MSITPPDGKINFDSNLDQFSKNKTETDVSDKTPSTLAQKRKKLSGAARSRRPNTSSKPNAIRKLALTGILSKSTSSGSNFSSLSGGAATLPPLSDGEFGRGINTLMGGGSHEASIKQSPGQSKRGGLTPAYHQKELVERFERTQNRELKKQLAKQILKQDDEITRNFDSFKNSFRKQGFSSLNQAAKYFNLLAKLNIDFDKNALRDGLNPGGSLTAYSEYLNKIDALYLEIKAMRPDNTVQSSHVNNGGGIGMYERQEDDKEDLNNLNRMRDKLIDERVAGIEKKNVNFLNRQRVTVDADTISTENPEHVTELKSKTPMSKPEMLKSVGDTLTKLESISAGVSSMIDNFDKIEENGISFEQRETIAKLIETIQLAKQTLEMLKEYCGDLPELDDLRHEIEDMDMQRDLEDKLKNPIISIFGSIELNQEVTTRLGAEPSLQDLPNVTNALKKALFFADDFLLNAKGLLETFMSKDKIASESTESVKAPAQSPKRNNALANFLNGDL